MALVKIKMINRQRKRALNIIRCHKNVLVLNLIKSEKDKISQLKSELCRSLNPEFISYHHGEIHVADGFTKQQTIKIELETLINAMNSGDLTLDEYHKQLDCLINNITTTAAKQKNKHSN